MATRRNVTEKYYDCLQCAEQCRHTVTNSNNNNNSNSTNNNINGGEASGVNSNANGNTSNHNNNNNNNNVSNNSGNVSSSGSSGGSKKRANAKTSATTSSGFNARQSSSSNVSVTTIKEVTRFDKETRRYVLPRSGATSKHNASRNAQSIPLTPAKKRSSLARPVRVHDSFVQSKRLIATGYALQQQQHQYGVNQFNHQQQQQQQQQQQEQQRHVTNAPDCPYDQQEEEHVDEETWPIRLRLEQMLELTLLQTKRKKKKKKKKSMMLMSQQQGSKHGFKDTERLLKVLSINNVDQDNRYNVKRCSVM